MIKALILGIAASFFFAFTFIFNYQMNVSGGSWLWSSSLRFLFMLPILFVILVIKREVRAVFRDIKEQPLPWLLWSTVGFGLFYAPACLASVYGASWLTAATWQVTIIAGALMTPLFYHYTETEDGIHRVRNKIPGRSLALSFIILAGIFIMQLEEAMGSVDMSSLIGVIPMLIAAFAYPLGNRKMIVLCSSRLTTLQRVFGMTLCSMPFWVIIAAAGIATAGPPGKEQVVQSLIVAVFSGVIATLLFFKATDMVNHSPSKLAVIESTQAGEVIFTLLGGVLLFHDRIPTLLGFIGIFIVVAGMVINSLLSAKKA